MSEHVPKVTIGLPVYNGANHLSEAIGSCLDQTFEDFELVIVDNASTDATEDISRTYAREDARVRYIRNEYNIGAISNFNKAFRIANTGSPYFKWAAADDICRPTFLENCVAALDGDPSAVFACTEYRMIDDEGDFLPYDQHRNAFISRKGRPKVHGREPEPGLLSADPVTRFKTVLHSTTIGTIIYGLFRTSALRKAPLFGLQDGDRVLLAEHSLLGRFQRIPEQLFWRREMEDRSRQEYVQQIHGDRAEHISSPLLRSLVNHVREMRNYFNVIKRSNLNVRQKRQCITAIALYALRPELWKRLFIPGPDNYWGIQFGNQAKSSPGS